jgi:hypothetical protein
VNCFGELLVTILKIGIPKLLLLLTRLTRFRPMRASDFISLTNKSFENNFNHERESKGLGIPFFELYRTVPDPLKVVPLKRA